MNITSTLLLAISLVETGGEHNPSTAIGDNGFAHGRYQIHECVVKDVNRIYIVDFSFPDDCYDDERAHRIALLYLTYWTSKLPENLRTEENAARIWNGGPRGWEKDSTIPYWDKVKQYL